jgi:hypothetical protein
MGKVFEAGKKLTKAKKEWKTCLNSLNDLSEREDVESDWISFMSEQIR